MATRVAARPVSRVLEIAAGTGAVTRRLAATLPASASIVATDLNRGMLDQAEAQGTGRPVEWRQADAMQLPFEDGGFDAVVCQFGVMFFPDKGKAFAEARRVLRPGGRFLLSVWDRIEENEFADTVTTALARRFPEDPPRFLVRTPHGHADRDALARDLAAGGFTRPPEITTLPARSRAASPDVPAVGFCQGTAAGGWMSPPPWPPRPWPSGMAEGRWRGRCRPSCSWPSGERGPHVQRRRMTNDDEVKRLLTEIRDLQRRHFEAYGRAIENQQESIRLQREAVARSRRYLAAVGVVIALVLVIVLVLLSYVLRHYR
jgi:SAM-dependent methyltransferase